MPHPLVPLGSGNCAVTYWSAIVTTTFDDSLNFVDQASVKWKQTQLDTNKQNVSSQIAAMNAATASVVTLTSGKTKSLKSFFCH